MAIERTLSMIKPDAVAAGVAGAILQLVEGAGLRVVACRKLRLTPAQARAFYAVHEGKHFYEALVAFMTEGPIFAQVLEGENAIERYRKAMGATSSRDAAAGTIRRLYGQDVQRNAVHGSDCAENAAREISFFFPGCDLL